MNEKYSHIYKVFLKGNKEALDKAYRHTLRYLAEFEQDFGEESIPGALKLEIDEIDGYRVISFMTDGAGLCTDYSDIAGIEQCIWVLHNDGALIAQTNDVNGLIISSKGVFGIPEDDYEIITPLTDEEIEFEDETFG